MKKITKYLLIAVVALSSYACSDWLDVVPEGDVTIDDAFMNRAQTERFLFTVYNALPHFDEIGGLNFFAGDEHWTLPLSPWLENIMNAASPSGNGMNPFRISRGEQEVSNPWMNFWDSGRGGRNMWTAIRNAHIFLENVHRPRDMSEDERTRWIAEATFLKAYYHFFLMKLYGPIPIMREPISVGAQTYEVRVFRDPICDVVDYIVSTIDSVLDDLPLNVFDPASEMGRITRPIAAAVRAQALLFAASPLMNGNPYFVNVVDSRGVHLFPQYDNARWARAAEAARKAIDIAHEAGHHLYLFQEAINISETTRTKLSIRGAVTEHWNREIIWGHTRAGNWTGRHAIQSFAIGRPIGLGGIGPATHGTMSLLASTLDVAEQFFSSNGVFISEDNSPFWTDNFANRHSVTTIPAEGINQYILEVGRRTAYLHLNRELRFYSNLTFSGSVRFMTPLMANDAPGTLWRYDFRFRQPGGNNGSGEAFAITGYLNATVVSFRSSIGGANSALTAPRYAFPIIRLADLYLMYAEALNESLAAPNSTVHHYVDMVRERAGLNGVVHSWQNYSRFPNRPLTQDGMRQIIRAERLNELAGEGARFWDMRRWRIPRAEVVRGWNTAGETVEDFYQVTEHFVRPRQSYRDFLWPISRQAKLRNPNLVQNPGWE